MASYWSEDETLDLFNISIKNFQKFVHLKNQNESDKFFEEKYFARFHNIGRNWKNIKNRIEGIQKKFRKNVKNLNLNNFKSGDIPEEIYTCIGSEKMFNTCFDYERLFGKYTGSKELIKIIEVVSQSDYWKSIRSQLHFSRISGTLKTNSSFFKETPNDTITISSEESSPVYSKRMNFDETSNSRETELIDSHSKNKVNRRLSSYSDKQFNNTNETAKRKRHNSMNISHESKIQIMSEPISNDAQNLNSPDDKCYIDTEIQTDEIKSAAASTQVELTQHHKGTVTDYSKPNLALSKIHITEIGSTESDHKASCSSSFQDIILAINNMTKEQSRANDIMIDISKSLKDIVNQKIVFLSCNNRSDEQ